MPSLCPALTTVPTKTKKSLPAPIHAQRFVAVAVAPRQSPFPPASVSLDLELPRTAPHREAQPAITHIPKGRSRPPTDPAGMTRHSSGSSEDGDTLHVEVPHVSSSNQSALRPQAAAQPSTSTSPDSTASHHHQRRSSADPRTSSSISRRSTSINWKPTETRNGSLEKPPSPTRPTTPSPLGLIPTANGSHAKKREMEKAHEAMFAVRHQRWRSPWAIGLLALVASITGIALLLTVVHSSVTRQIDPKGCRMSYLRPSYAKLNEFDTEHTRLASKYSLYMYREQGIDHDTRVRGVPVLFIPGNAGSYKQVRPIASEAANYFHDVLQHDPETYNAGIRSLDFFTVDFNEDITAFHGQTLLDQAEYLNEAIRYILSLYLDPRVSDRNPDLPDPTSVIVLGHSMGGIVARTMLIMPNYQTNSINTIITMSAPHARPPVSFDSQIVKAYKDINDYWRHAYSQQWANNNPLWHVTLVSIAGGGLDTVVPSDYASVESLVPDTHGFTVFTSTIPTVWTSMDHQAILWCDQFRKVLVRTLFDLSDVHRASQTKPRAERMRVFKKRLLTGMETVAEKTAPRSDPTTLLTVEDNSDTIIAQGERLVLRQLGTTGRVRAHLMTIPPPGPPEVKRFTLMTDIKLDQPGENGKLEVMFCSVVPSQPGQTGAGFPSQIDLSKGTAGTTRLACRNAAPDVIPLPGSNKTTTFPFYRDLEKQVLPFYYLEYDLDDIAEQQFIAVVEKATNPTQGFVIAEFSEQSQSHQTAQIGLQRLLTSGLKFTMPAARPMVTEIKVPSLQSSLLAYNLRLSSHSCGNKEELFAPMVRQYLVEPFESKYFVNVRDAPISLHGVAPYVPPPLAKRSASEDGLSFQFWTDPTCDSSIEVELEVDFSGSLGKLYMRYRTVFAAFPLLVVALVLRKQFRVYDTTGVFITFTESLDLCLRQSIPLMLASLTMLTVATANPNPAGSASFWHWNKSTSSLVDFHLNDYLIGTQDPMFLFLIPVIGIICVGVCTVFNYITLALTHLLSSLFNLLAFRPAWVRNDERKKQGGAGFLPSSPRRRMITTAVLLFLVSTAIPYQFAYLVACLVQLTTTVRAQRIAQELQSAANSSFYNYVHSILILMLWILPINLPTLVVWIHNLAVHWLTPFTSHHNVLSIMPFIVLVETLTTGKMVPPVTGRMKHLTSILLFGIAIYAAVYGISYAYTLHHLVNLVAFWLVILHSTSDSWPISGLKHLYEGDAEDRKGGKEP